MNVWIMNLKDNRDNPTQNLEMTKFNFCKSKGIIGIGWVGYDENSDDSAFLLASNYIKSFLAGDLVWTRDPETQKYYLCKIKTIAQNANEEFNKYDISRFCYCDYIEIGTADELPQGINKEELVTRHTIQKASENVSTATFVFWKKKSVELKKKGKKGSWGKFIKKHYKALIAVAVVIAVIVGGFIAADAIKEKIIYDKVCEQFDGKVFKREKRIYYNGGDIDFVYFIAFEGDKASSVDWRYSDSTKEYLNLEDETLDDFSDIKVYCGLFSNEITLQNSNGVFSRACLNQDGTVILKYSLNNFESEENNWQETTMEEVNKIKKELSCNRNHSFKETVIKRPNCTESGETLRVCKKCGLTETETTSAEHKYQKGICKYCKQKEPPEKTNLKGNTWYVYNPLEQVKFQNVVITNAFTIRLGKGANVSCYYFCSHCLTIDDWPQLVNLYFNSPFTRVHTCDICGKTTTVRIELQ